MTQYFTTIDGLKLAYDDQGSGHPVLCLPGLTRNMDDFLPILRNFGDRARIIRLDLRGRGGSDYDTNYANYNVARETQDVLELLDHLGLAKVTILGTSRGGLIAMLLAAQAKDRLSGVLLNDIGPVVDTEGLEEILGYIGKQPTYKTHEEAAEKLPSAMRAWFVNVSHEHWLAHARALWEATDEGLRIRYDKDLVRAFTEQADGAELPAIWPLFDALDGLPVALVRGGNSNLLSRETVSEMRQRQPDIIYAEVPDRGHVPFLNEPEAVAAIETLLERIA